MILHKICFAGPSEAFKQVRVKLTPPCAVEGKTPPCRIGLSWCVGNHANNMGEGVFNPPSLNRATYLAFLKGAGVHIFQIYSDLFPNVFF